MRSLARSLLLCVASLSPRTLAQSLNSDQIELVKQTLAQNANHSWEIGTRSQALLELDAPSLSVLTVHGTVPVPRSLNASTNASIAEVLTIARNAVAALPPGFASNANGQPLIDGDGAAGDPVSLGVAVLVANYTGQPGLDYAGAAEAQMRFLLTSVPRTSDGALSHRDSEVQLWADSVYMVPPFLAYYGVTTNNVSMVNEAYNQIKLYRSYLRDDSGVWRHITLGSFNDTGLWSTGNGWAAMGMLRVLGTMQNSPMSGSFKQQMKDITNWVFEIQRGMYANISTAGLFRNYIDKPNDFEDASSTALIAASVYRLSLLAGRHTYLPFAERSRQALFAANGTSSTPPSTSISSSSLPPSSAPVSSAGAPAARAARAEASTSSHLESTTSSKESSSLSSSPSTSKGASSTVSSSAAPSPSGARAFVTDPHFTTDGWLMPVVNPLTFDSLGSESPEGQAFVLMMESAYRDWVAAGSVGANGATRLSYSQLSIAAAVGSTALLLVLA